MPTSLGAGCGRAEGSPGKSANRSRGTLNNELIFLLDLALDRLDVAAPQPVRSRSAPKVALAAAKRRGVKLGGPRLDEARRRALSQRAAS
jgi:hypothetical protein